MIVATRRPMASLKSVLVRLRREYFPNARFTQRGAGIAVVEDHQRTLASAFQPVVQAGDGAVSGHHALLRAAGTDGRTLAPAELFRGVHDEAAVGELDRMARALHAVNYFAGSRQRSRLYLPVDSRLLADATEEHRAYFDAVLSFLDVPTSRVVMSLPRDALDDPVTFVRSTMAFSTRGYRVLATMRLEDAHADLDHVLMAGPHYVAIDAAGAASACGYNERWKRLRALVATLRARGITAIARRIENAGDHRAARDAGFGLLQGWHFAPPYPQP